MCKIIGFGTNSDTMLFICKVKMELTDHLVSCSIVFICLQIMAILMHEYGSVQAANFELYQMIWCVCRICPGFTLGKTYLILVCRLPDKGWLSASFQWFLLMSESVLMTWMVELWIMTLYRIWFAKRVNWNTAWWEGKQETEIMGTSTRKSSNDITGMRFFIFQFWFCSLSAYDQNNAESFMFYVAFFIFHKGQED